MLRKLMFAMLAVAVAGCLVGCGKRRTTITGPEGERATVETDRGGKTTVTVESDEGEAKMEISEDVDLSGLGVEIYPGAEPQAGTTYKGEGFEGVEMTSVALETSDAFDKVAEFYKSKYAEGAAAVVQQPGSLMISKEEETRNVTVAVTRDEDEQITNIGITVVMKAEE